MGNMEHGEQEWEGSALLSRRTFSKDLPLQCKGMDSIPEKKCLLALLTYVILKGTGITEAHMSRLHVSPPFSEMR